MRGAIMVALTVFAAQAAVAQTENFDNNQAGVTGRRAARWAVRPDASAPSAPHVLQQSGTGAFPWIVRTGTSVEDGFVEVKFKALAGKEDQAGGVVWRWKNGENYYVARANALENNVSPYHTQGGRRITLKYVDAPVPPQVWLMLRAGFSGTRIAVWFNGKKTIEMEDGHIADPGAVGLWTKADSVTAFDDFGYGSAPAQT
jgi:hypothetical protein